MTTKASLLKQFKESMPAWRSEATLYRYPKLCEKFIDYIGVKSKYTRSDAIRFLNHIINSGLSKNYARWSAYILKQFYQSLDIDFPLSARDLPQIEPGDIVAPVFSSDYIKILVDAVREKGDPRMQAYLALSTVFGPRREELASLSSKDIKDGVIIIQTVKHGETRTLTIPPEIQPYVDAYKFVPVHPQTMTNLFKRIQALAGYKHGERDGWHAPRRSLVTGLMNAGLPISHVYCYMGWKLSNRLGILGVYTRPDFKDVEKVIYSQHPFLKYWT